jgi:hypothetical protein
MALEGKGFYIWKIHKCEGGDASAIVRRAQQAGLSHALIKIADGPRAYNVDLAGPLVDALQAAGLKAWGWQFVYGDEPFGEADIAIHRIRTLALDGFVVNAETAYKGKHAQASVYMDRLRGALPDAEIALSSFRFPRYHSTLPWTEFLSHCDYNMPQVYWVQADNPDQQIEWCIQQFSDIYPERPIIPTGSAYEEFGWRPQPSEISRFLQKAKELGLSAANFWSWDYAGSPAGGDLWAPVENFSWPVTAPPLDIVQKLENALNSGNIESILDLYQPNAVHVTIERTIKGRDEMRIHYAELINQLLPGARFDLTTMVAESSVRHVTWNASSPNRNQVVGGQDTIGIRQGLIQYHSSMYRVVSG